MPESVVVVKQSKPTLSRRIYDYRSWLLIALTVWAVISGGLTGYAMYLAAQRPTARIVDVQLLGSSILCPGDMLSYQFTLAVSHPAPVDIYTSEVRVASDEHVSDTRLQHLDFATAPVTIRITRHWILPPVYADPINGLGVPWLPGDYVQRVSTGVVGRTELDSVNIPFHVASTCIPTDHTRG